MQKSLFLFLCFACIGLSTEVFFTAFSDLYLAFSSGKQADLSLTGHTYVWMFLIYGFGILFFLKIRQFLAKLPLLIRLFCYASLIICIEFTTGFLLQKTIGECPWHYTEGIHILGLARLDYLPFWMVFSFLGEKILFFLEALIERK